MLEPPGDTSDRARSDLGQELYLIADELRGIANQGRYYAANLYEAERADQALKLAARIAALADAEPLPLLTALFEDHCMHVSPRIGVDALVRNPAGEILLVKRRDNGHWCMPGGFAEIGETPAEAALRELWEEAGLRGEVTRLLGIFDSRVWGLQTKTHLLSLVFLVECEDLVAVPGSEMVAARFYDPDRLPGEMSIGQPQWVPICLERAETGGGYADPSSSYDLDLPMHQRPGHE
jgi:ADP-ribose pyrophosphatase YjhB (NUDIX family)